VCEHDSDSHTTHRGNQFIKEDHSLENLLKKKHFNGYDALYAAFFNGQTSFFAPYN